MAVRRKGLGRGLDGLIPNYKSDKTENAEKTEKQASKPAKAEKKPAKASKPAKSVKKEISSAKKDKEETAKTAAEESKQLVEEVIEEILETETETTEAENEVIEETTENVSRETFEETSVKDPDTDIETESFVEAAEKLIDAFDNGEADVKTGAAVIEAAAEVERKTEEGGPVYLKISEVEPNKEQPRRRFNEDALAELSESIKQYGVISPLIVKQRDGYYEIVAGERRWRAAKMAGLKKIPVIIRDLTDKEIMEISLIENIQREDLNPIEEAEAFQKLLTDFSMTQDELASRVSRSRTAITNAIRLLKLDKRVQEMLIDEMITSGHARALLGIEDGDMQKEAADKIFDEHLSVRDTEKLVKLLTGEKKQKKPVEKADTSMDYIYQDMEEKMKEIFGTKVVVNRKNDKKGKIEIEYYSNEELERLYDLLTQLRR